MLFIVFAIVIAEVMGLSENRGTCDTFSCSSPNGDACYMECSTFKQNECLIKLLEARSELCSNNLSLKLYNSLEYVNSEFLNGNFRLKNLIFELGSSEFEDNAFDKPSLNSLRYLSISNLRLKAFTNSTFEGLSLLEHFEYIDTKSAGALEGSGFLQPFANTLQTLVIRDCSRSIDPKHWFEGSSFKQIKNIDLGQNSFYAMLRRSSFTGVKSVEQLLLNYSKIESFETDTFDDMLGTLEFLDLSNNQLVTLEFKFLSRIIGNEQLTLDLSGNKWHCACEYADFLKAVKWRKINYTQEPVCSSPPTYNDVSIRQLNFPCLEEDGETSTKPGPIETVTDDSQETTSKEEDFVQLVCQGGESHEISKADVNFSLVSVDSTTLSIIIDEASLRSYWQLLYYPNNKWFEAINSEIDSSKVEISGLYQKTMYIFCLIRPNATLVSPFNCQSHFMFVEHGEKATWLYTEDQPLVITVFIILIILLFIMGLLIMYFVVRWRPTLLGHSPRIVRLSSKSHEVILTDSNDDVFEYYSAMYSGILSADLYQDQHLEPWERSQSLSPQYRAPAIPYIPSECDTKPENPRKRLRDLEVLHEREIEEPEESLYQTLKVF